MNYKQVGGKCKTCGKVMVQREMPPSGCSLLLLLIVTCGLYLPVLLIRQSLGQWRCTQCGRKAKQLLFR